MIKVYTLNDKLIWDKIVSSFKKSDVYYLSSYVKAFNLNGDGIPLLIYAEVEKAKGINVVIKRDISLLTDFSTIVKKDSLFDLSTPYGYGGWIFEGESKDILLQYKQWCYDNNIVSEFVRFHPVIKNYDLNSDLYKVTELGPTVTIPLSSEDSMWSLLDKKNRNVIRKAINNGIVINHDLNESIMNSFKSIYETTMNKDNADEYYYFNNEFYNSILTDLKDNALIFYATLDNKIIAASIIIFYKDYVSYHLSGSLQQYQKLAPSNLLLWEVMKYFSNKGYKTFHLGGGVGSKEDSLFHFKKVFFKGEYTKFYIGQSIFMNEKYDELCNIKSSIKNKNYFPKYRG